MSRFQALAGVLVVATLLSTACSSANPNDDSAQSVRPDKAAPTTTAASRTPGMRSAAPTARPAPLKPSTPAQAPTSDAGQSAAGPAAPNPPERYSAECAIGSAGWRLDGVTFRESPTSTVRNLGIGDEYTAEVTVTVLNAANYPLTSYGISVQLIVPTVRNPNATATAHFLDFAVAANSYATLTTTTSTIFTDLGESPTNWSLSSGTRGGNYLLQTPSDYDYLSFCGAESPQPFRVLT